MKPSRLLVAASLAVMVALGATAALADCRLSGRNYPVGTVVGNLVCTDNGWAPRGG
jgi:hypothetical protein